MFDEKYNFEVKYTFKDILRIFSAGSVMIRSAIKFTELNEKLGGKILNKKQKDDVETVEKKFKKELKNGISLIKNINKLKADDSKTDREKIFEFLTILQDSLVDLHSDRIGNVFKEKVIDVK